MEQNKNLRRYAQDLRKKQTKEESLLWYQFLSRYPLRFRRQYVIGNYIADFYCHKAKLVVELALSIMIHLKWNTITSVQHIWNLRDCGYCGLPIWIFSENFAACAKKSI